MEITASQGIYFWDAIFTIIPPLLIIITIVVLFVLVIFGFIRRKFNKKDFLIPFSIFVAATIATMIWQSWFDHNYHPCIDIPKEYCKK